MRTAAASLFALSLALAPCAGCASTREPELHYESEPENELEELRAQVRGATTPGEELRGRKELFQRMLSLGITQDAAVEYLQIRALANGDDPAALRALCLATLRWALRDAAPARRLQALRDARWTPLPEEQLALARLGLADPHPEVRAEALRLSASVAFPLARAVETLARGSRDPEPVVREAAQAALSQLLTKAGEPSAAALEVLLEGLGDPDASVRLAALAASASAPRAWRSKLLPSWDRLAGNLDEGVACRAAALLRSEDPVAARRAFARGGHSSELARGFQAGLRVEDELTPVREGLSSSFAEAGRSRAWQRGCLLGLAGAAPEALEPLRSTLIELLSTAGSPAPVRMLALERLARAPRSTLARLCLGQAAAGPALRGAAAARLVRSGEPSLALVERLLAKRDPATAGVLLEALRLQGEHARLVAALQVPELRASAIEVLAREGNGGDALREVLASSRRDERLWALRGLSFCATGADADPLLVELTDPGTDLAAAGAVLALCERKQLVSPRPAPAERSQPQ